MDNQKNVLAVLEIQLNDGRIEIVTVKKCDEIKIKLRKKSEFFPDDTVKKYLDDKIMVMAGMELEKGALYADYKKWCAEKKHIYRGRSFFASCVFNSFSAFTRPNAQQRPGTGRKRIWPNLTWKN